MIVLTGATGFIGCHVRMAYQTYPSRLICLRHSTQQPNDGNIWRSNDLRIPCCDSIVTGGTVIIHLAALVKGSVEQLFKVNVDGTKHLLDIAKRHKVKKFIYISSDDVYFSNSPYARSKLAAEAIVQKADIPWVIIRPTVVFGPGDTKNIALINSVIRRWPIMPLPNRGTFKWQPVFAGDLAKCIINIVNSTLENKFVYVCGPEQLTFRSIVDQLMQHNEMRRSLLPISHRFTSLAFSLIALTLRNNSLLAYKDTFQDKLIQDNSVIMRQMTTPLQRIFNDKSCA